MRLFAACLLLTGYCISFADESGTIRAFESAKASDPQLIAFLREMPKGGDLHNHVSGAAYSDFMLDSQVGQSRFFDPTNSSFTSDKTKTPSAQLLVNNAMLYSWLNKISMRGWTGGGQTGHDHFFDTFSYIGSAMDGMASASVLSEVVGRALWQHEHYMELMTGVTSDDAYNAYMSSIPDSFDMEKALAIQMPKLELLSADSKAYLTLRDKDLTNLLNLRKSVNSPMAPITVRYIWSCNRLSSNDKFFAQAAAGLYLASKDKRVCALNIVAPEDHPLARLNFNRQMQILDFLWNKFGKPNITLHCGELTMAVSPVEPMRDRFWKTIELGHARRIGHGVSVAWSDNVNGLLAKMKHDGIAVEVCLTSNHSILGVDGTAHPLNLYRKAGVPVFLNTDDEGVSRSNLTTEHLRAVRDQGLGYMDFKEMARNSLEYSFLTGKSLYSDRNYKKLTPGFEEVRKENWKPSPAAEKAMDGNDKLAVEVRFERSIIDFESKF